jgi:sulfur-oxidizing protein SoxX
VGPKPQADSGPAALAKWPCLSETLNCGKISNRKPIQAVMAGQLGGEPAAGKAIAFDVRKGNCLACHAMIGGVQPGTRGPDPTKYGTWGRSDAETYSLVFDMRWRNSETIMPPFGTNEILADKEIREVVAFLQSSK